VANILLTGGAGFIGSHVAESLIRRGHKLWILDDLSGGSADNVPKEAAFVEGSILDRSLLDQLFSEHQFTYVFHLAANAAESLSHFIKHFIYQNNLIGSINLINLSIVHDIKCFVFTSSIAVYGTNQLPMTESLKPAPEDSYGIAKYAVEQELEASRKMFGLPYMIFRLHNVYGERQNIGDQYRNVIGIFMNQIMQKKAMTIFGDGTQKRAFSHIADVAPIIASGIEIPPAYNEVFNIGADKPYTINELAKEVASLFGINPEIQYLDRRNEVDEAYSDHSKAKEILKAESQVSLKEGLKRMVEWAQQHGIRQSKDFDQIEISKSLPPSWRKP